MIPARKPGERARAAWQVLVVFLLIFSTAFFSATRFVGTSALDSVSFQAHGNRAPISDSVERWIPPPVMIAMHTSENLAENEPTLDRPLSRSLDNRPPPSL